MHIKNKGPIMHRIFVIALASLFALSASAFAQSAGTRSGGSGVVQNQPTSDGLDAYNQAPPQQQSDDNNKGAGWLFDGSNPSLLIGGGLLLGGGVALAVLISNSTNNGPTSP
jgi:hypothetical protein